MGLPLFIFYIMKDAVGEGRLPCCFSKSIVTPDAMGMHRVLVPVQSHCMARQNALFPVCPLHTNALWWCVGSVNLMKCLSFHEENKMNSAMCRDWRISTAVIWPDCVAHQPLRCDAATVVNWP